MGAGCRETSKSGTCKKRASDALVLEVRGLRSPGVSPATWRGCDCLGMQLACGGPMGVRGGDREDEV